MLRQSEWPLPGEVDGYLDSLPKSAVAIPGGDVPGSFALKLVREHMVDAQGLLSRISFSVAKGRRLTSGARPLTPAGLAASGVTQPCNRVQTSLPCREQRHSLACRALAPMQARLIMTFRIFRVQTLAAAPESPMLASAGGRWLQSVTSFTCKLYKFVRQESSA